jgi:hypothetical protein
MKYPRLVGIAVVSSLAAGGLLQAEDVAWVNAVGVSINGSSLAKTGGASAWDAGAASHQVIRDGYGYVDFEATETTTYRACGLSVGDPGQSRDEIDYAVELQPWRSPESC